MCNLCEEREDGEMISCPYCGILVCWDVEASDDVVAKAAATCSGDMACIDCAIRIDRDEAIREANDGFDDFDPYEPRDDEFAENE